MRTSPSGYHRKAFPEMSEEELRYVWRRLRANAYKNYGWLEKGIGKLDVDELILDAIEDAYVGKRNCPVTDRSGNKVSFFVFAWQIVRSKISHIVEKESKHPSCSIEEILENSKPGHLEALLRDSPRSSDPGKRIYCDQLVAKLKERIGSDETLLAILELKLRNPDISAGEIGDQLVMSESEAANASKRLNRQAQALLKECENNRQ